MKLTENNFLDGGGRLAFRLAAIAFLAFAARPLLCATPPQLSDVRVALDPTNRTVNVTYALDREAIVTVAFEADGEPVGDRADSALPPREVFLSAPLVARESTKKTC